MFWRLGFWKKDKEAHMTINNDNNKEVNNKTVSYTHLTLPTKLEV